ncbi:hypothetical protein [Pseudomonas viridiflava]|uniref:hypothetical protein n=1 Tax=Pseudomonas viridiflava TaxID=33069 RepID=UPI000F062CC1|nr:hypothetical protein [Pseudomonas viridiflava]
MKQKASALILMIGAAVLTAQARADDFPACAAAAAQEFAVPLKLFKAMALAEGWSDASAESRKQAESRHKYGPMGLGEPAIPVVASGLGVSAASVKEDACTNYRAAAWWFVNKSGGTRGDMWSAVTRFYYGTPTRTNAYATERVKKIYAEL